jgi:hypothetical protein
LRGIERLLKLQKDDGKSYLRKLHSVLVIPNADDKPVEVYHLSFQEILMCNDHEYLKNTCSADPSAHHTCITQLCLAQIIKSKASCRMGNDIGDQDQFPIPKDTYGALEYSCCYWGEHLVNNHMSYDALADILYIFAKQLLFYWMEILIILKDAGGAADSLACARTWLTVSLWVLDCCCIQTYFCDPLLLGPV